MVNKKRVYFILIVIFVVAVVVEVFFAHPHLHHIWNTVPGADVVIGFAGAWILIILAKKLMAGLLQRDEDYYDDGGEDDA